MPKGDNQPAKLDRDALHELLFRRADRLGRLKLNVKALAAELDRGYCHFITIIGEMEEEGRWRCMSSARTKGPKTYLILDPEVWKAKRGTP